MITEPTTELESVEIVTEASAIADLAERAVDIEEPFDAVFVGDQRRLQLLDLEEYRDRPRRCHGTAKVETLPDMTVLAEAWAGHPAHLVYAASSSSGQLARVEAVLNDHDAAEPGHGDWTITHTPALSEPFTTWLAACTSGGLNQRQFAELIEDNLAWIAAPAAGDLLDVSTEFASTTTIRFSSAMNLRNGRQRLTYDEAETTDAGASGNVEVPDRITLVLPIYRHGATETVQLGLRYRVAGGALTIMLRILEQEEMWATANETHLAQLDDAFTLIAGTRG